MTSWNMLEAALITIINKIKVCVCLLVNTDNYYTSLLDDENFILFFL